MEFNKRKLNIAVLAGGPSSEYEISLSSAKNSAKALIEIGHNVRKIHITKRGDWFSGHYRKEPKKILEKFDVVVNALHGQYGEDGQVQSLLNRLHMPYTGSGAIAAALAIEKLASKRLFGSVGLLTPRTIGVQRLRIDDYKSLEKKVSRLFNFPVVIKPNSRGSSLGVQIVDNPNQLQDAFQEVFKFDETAVVQEFIKGVEVSCGVIETRSGLIALSPIMIIPLKEKRFFDYQAKYNPAYCKEIIPAPLNENTVRKVKQTALKAHKVLGLRHYSRADMIIANDNVYVLEINALPGLTKNSLLPKALAEWGMSLPQFLEHIIELAMRPQRKEVEF